MKNLSNFNLLIIILLFSSCRQQPFTGTVHIIPYPNQIAIGTQYRPIGKTYRFTYLPKADWTKIISKTSCPIPVSNVSLLILNG